MHPSNIFSEPFTLLKEFRLSGKNSTSLGMRLFAFLIFFLLAIIAGMLMILMMTGIFKSGEQRSYVWMENELNHLNQGAYNDFGKLSLQGIALAEKISSGLQNGMKENGVSASDLQEHPELLDDLLSSQTDNLLAALKSAGTSGAFIILKATVNPALENAESSRAGIFLKSTEPNIATAVDANIRYLRGPAEVAREHTLELLPQWRMEFEITEGDFFDITMSAAKENNKLPLAQLYHWSGRLLLSGNSESGMLLSVPLIDKSGIVFGICGFEFSSMRFKNSFSPDNSTYSEVFSTLSPIKDNGLALSDGLIAGNYYQTNLLVNGSTQIINRESGFCSFPTEDEKKYEGLHKTVALYPSSSVFANEVWFTAVMMPASDLAEAVSSTNQKLFLSFAVLLLLSLAIAAFISCKYISPVLKALNMVKTEDRSNLPKTRISEIDDLFEFLALQDEKIETQQRQNIKPDLTENPVPEGFAAYDLFVKNIKTLSPAEKSVFNLYMLGHTANEISDILCLSINTIKTHNKRIYMKLNVSSRKELMVFVQMMREKSNVNRR